VAGFEFTIFAGPDAGRKFRLGDRPLSIGRDPAREICLNDDRASRLHATLAADGDEVILVDQNSSNGTFLNGRLISRAVVAEGDVITIGSTQMVRGSEAPSPEQLRVLSGMRVAHALREQGIGETTIVLSEDDTSAAEERVVTRPVDVIEAVVEAAQPLATARGVRLVVETADGGGCVQVHVERRALYRGLAELVELLLKCAQPAEGTMALRYDRDPERRGGLIVVTAVGIPVMRDELRHERARAAVEQIARSFRAAGAAMELAPEDETGVLARVYMPCPPTAAAETYVQPTER